MARNSSLVGVWQAMTTYQEIPDSQASLVFKSDGTGWFEIYNVYKWEQTFFQWEPTSQGWTGLTATKRLEPHIYTRKAIEVPLVFEFDHLPYEVKNNESRRVLDFEWPDVNIKSFDSVDLNPETYNPPKR